MARTAWSPWLRWAHARRRAAHPDFGDYGTAFGLELTLRGEPGPAQDRATLPGSDLAAGPKEPRRPPASPARPAQPGWAACAGWFRRWLTRRA